jgi:hypothetical protein
MNKLRRSPHMFIFAITMLVGLPSPSPVQVRVPTSGGFSAAYQELLPYSLPRPDRDLKKTKFSIPAHY